MSGFVFVLSPSLICRCVTFDVQAWSSVQRSYLVVLVSFNGTPVPLNWRLFELGINCRQHVKMFLFDWKRRVLVHCHYDGVQIITSRSNLPFYNVEFGADILNYHDCMENSWKFTLICFFVLWMSCSCASCCYSWMRFLLPSMMRSAVPHLFLKEMSLTTIAVISWNDLDMCISVGSEAWCWGFHVSGDGVVGYCWRWWPTPVLFIISEKRSSARVGEISAGGWSFISPSTFLNLLWLYRPCLLITGLYSCHPNLVCYHTMSWC